MKIELIKINNENIEYPCLMATEGQPNRIILFHKPGHGTVVHQQKSEHPVGYYSEGWHVDSFKIVNVAVKLSNDWSIK